MMTAKLSKASVDAIVRSIIENTVESIGDIIGRREQDVFFADSIYLVLTTKGTPNQVGYENDSARQRLRDYNKINPEIIGFYHNHLYKPYEQQKLRLHKCDRCLLRCEMKKLGLEESLQIIAGVKKTDSKQERQTGVFTTQYSKKARIVVVDTPLHYYDIHIASYLLTPETFEEIRTEI